MKEEKTLTVKYLGTLTGDTYETSAYSMTVGEEYDVSETEALRLHNDFPKHFKIEGFSGKSADKEPSDLMGFTRAELNERAEALGIKDAEDLPNKTAVVTAIETVSNLSKDGGE